MQRRLEIRHSKLSHKLLITNDLGNNFDAEILVLKHFCTPSV
jgi:hypothetical protein